MPNMTFAVPAELHKRMKRRTDIKWGDVARQSFEARLKQLAMLDDLLKNSEFTEKDAEMIGNDIKRKMRLRWDALHPGHKSAHRRARTR
jgi:hypothetical protein